MTEAVFDFEDIARRLKGEPDKEEIVCGLCEGGGWIMSSTPAGKPIPVECPDCGNPEDLLCP